MLEWVKIPTTWLLNKEEPPLRKFTWKGSEKSNYIAALMLYICVAQQVSRIDNKSKVIVDRIKLSYSKLCTLTSLSRAKVSAGLDILSSDKLLEIDKTGKTNIYKLVGLEGTGGWAKLPAKGLYDKRLEQIKPFCEFKLRQRVELDGLKLFLLLVALRDNRKNHATPKYKTISEYTGIPEARIRSAISLLVNFDMIHVQKYGEMTEITKRNNFYRIIGIDGQRHAGNTSYDKLFEINT